MFRGVLAPTPGGRAGATVKIRQGEKVLWEKNISADSSPLEVKAELREAAELIIEVDFSGRLAFPCGVDWRDAYVK